MNSKSTARVLARVLALALACGSLLTACDSAPSASAAPGPYRVFLASGGQRAGTLDVLTTGQQPILNLPLGTLSPDGSRLYVTAVDAGNPSLRALDSRNGLLVAQKAISAAYFEAAGIISANGRWVVRSFVDQNLTTHIGVFDTSSLAERDLTLRGVFSLDAINGGGSLLYLLETIGPGKYRVRDYDLVADRLDSNVIVDKTDASPVMSGNRVATLSTTDGEKVFGLYQRPGKAPFIHVLWTGQKLAWCVDLPPTGSADSAPGWSLLLDERNTRVYAINTAGIIAEVDYSNLPRLVRTASFQPPAPTSWRLPPSVQAPVTDALAKGYEGSGMYGRPALSLDGKMIYVPDRSGYITVGTQSLNPIARRLSGHGLSSLALSPDGKMLFAVEPASNQVLQVDPESGRQVATLRDPYPYDILRVEAFQTAG